MFRRVAAQFVLSALLVLGFTGCGSNSADANRPKRVPASGTVLFKQQPLANATIVFLPQAHTYAAVGTTDAAGRFRIQTFETDDGAVPGDYKVTITKLEEVAPPREGASDDDGIGAPMPKSLIPEKYGKVSSSGLTASVVETGKNEFTFTLE